MKAAIYEARNSDDVDFFLEHNPEQNSALLFYNSDENDIQEVQRNIDSVLSIFKNIGEEGRSTEDWVDSLNDRVHLMKVDVLDIDNTRIVKSFRVGHTPFVSFFKDGTPILEEVIDQKTFDNIKEIYQAEQHEKEAKEAEEKRKADSESKTPSSVFPDAEYVHNQEEPTPEEEYEASKESIEAAKKAQEAAEGAKKAAEEALKALKEAKKAFEQQAKLDKLKKEAEKAKEKAEKASKELEEAKKQIADHLAQDGKNSTQGNTSEINQQNQDGSQALVPPPGYTIEYIPVYRPIDAGESEPNSQNNPQKPVTLYGAPKNSQPRRVPSQPRQPSQNSGYSILSSPYSNQPSSGSNSKKVTRRG